MLMIKYKEIILPSIKDLRRRMAMTFYCHHFNELQWTAYQFPSAQRERGIQLRLFYLTYFITHLAKNLWGDKVMSVYLHSIHVHWAPFFKLSDFRNSSTEQGEAWLAFLKRVFRSYTNRKPKEALIELLLRMHEEAEVRLTGKKGRKDKASKISREFQKRHDWKECSFYESAQHSAFLTTLRENGFAEGTDWEVVRMETEGADGSVCIVSKVVFKTMSAVSKCL